ncbi:unnamed protein product [Phytomonas sp. EM1]|nr:unnamed protein product [Phytomonas sp. EM1]|eukprot:CCW60501.1 unnamed protein product [Phytomonas sp. isolate EM1]
MNSASYFKPEEPTLGALGRPTVEMTFRGHRQGVLCAAFQPTHHKLALSSSTGKPSSQGRRSVLPPKVLTGGTDGTVMLWDAKPTVRALRFLGHRGPVFGCAYSPKSLLIASCGHDGYARLVTPNLMRTSTTYPSPCSLQQRNDDYENCFSWRVHSGSARAIAFAQDGTDRLFTVGDDKSIKCWNLNYVSNTHSGIGFCGSKLASFSGPPSGATPEASFAAAHTGHTNWIRCLAVQGATASPNFSHCIASGGDDRCVHVWDTRARRAAHTFYEPKASIRGLSFGPEGYHLASGDGNGDINVFDLRVSSSADRSGPTAGAAETGRYGLVQRYPAAHEGAVHDVSFAPSGSWLLSAGEDGTAKLWDTCEGLLYCTMQAHDGPVRASRFSDDGQFFVTAGKDNVVMLWRSGIPIRTMPSRSQINPHADLIDETCTATVSQLDRQESVVKQQGNSQQSHITGGIAGRVLVSRQGSPSKGQPSPRASLSKLPPRPASQKGIKAGLRGGKLTDATDEVLHDEAAAGSSRPAANTTVASGQQQRERSFERDEKRYSSITTPYCVRVDDRKTNDCGISPLDTRERPDKIYEKEGKKQTSSVQRESESHAHQDESPYSKRMENVEHALAALAEYFQKQQSLVHQEIDSLKRHWFTHNEKQQDDIRGLNAKMEKLIEQQLLLMKRLDTSAETKSNEN